MKKPVDDVPTGDEDAFGENAGFCWKHEGLIVEPTASSTFNAVTIAQLDVLDPASRRKLRELAPQITPLTPFPRG